MAFKDINNDSMRGLMLFMNGRMCSSNEICWVGDDGNINIQLSNGFETVVKFVSMDEAEFSYAVSVNGPVIKKTITRTSEFNGALIEFSSKPKEYFEEIASGYKKCPVFYKQYTVIASEV